MKRETDRTSVEIKVSNSQVDWWDSVMEARMHTVQITADEILNVLINYANNLFVSTDVLTPVLEWGEEGIFTIRYYTKDDLT